MKPHRCVIIKRGDFITLKSIVAEDLGHMLMVCALEVIFLQWAERMFKSIICGIIALSSGVVMIENVAGMGTVVPEETVHISDRTQFFAITPEQTKTVKDISFSGQDIDENFCEHWCTIFSGINFNRLVFAECNFDNDSFFIFEGLIVTNLTAVCCGIKTSQAREILRAIDPYSIRNIDFSCNTLNNDGGGLYRMLCQYVGGGRMHLDILDLRGNSLLEFPYDRKNVGRILF